jgi:Nif-specific regulatory protein
VEDRDRPGHEVALKELAPGGNPDSLRREFATLSSLRHPNLVEVLDFDVDLDGRARFTMEAVEGKDVVAAAREEGGEAATGLLAEALRALAFLHAFGLLHRDLKPGNLLVRGTPRQGARLVVLDFGLASRRDTSDPHAAGLSGTLPYLAPEQFDGADASVATDLYAIGAVAYEAVHGRPPVTPRPDDLAGFIEAVRAGKRARPKIPAGWPAAIEVWLEQMLAPVPAERPPSAREALARLNALCGTAFPLETPETRAARLESGPPPGRERELETALVALDPARHPGPRVVWISGDFGTGKSRLLRAIESEAVARGWRVVKPAASELAALDTALAGWRETARTETTVLLLDETEEREGPAGALLDRIAREPSAPALRVAAAVRPQEVRHPVVRKLLDDSGVVPSLQRIDLGPLDDGALDALVERAGGVPTAARREWLAQAGERNPFATVQLLIEGAWEKGGRRKPVGALDAAIAGRLVGLSDRGKRRLDVVAAIDGEAPVEIVEEVAADGADRSVFEDLVARGLVRMEGAAVAPSSRALAAFVRGRCDAERLRALRREAAERLARFEGGEAYAARIARLYAEAGAVEEALAWAEKSAVASAEARRPDDAAAEYAFGASLLAPRDPRRFEWRRRQGEALLDAGRHAAAARALGGAARLATSERDRLRTRVRQAYAMALAGRRHQAARFASVALGEGRRISDLRVVVEAQRVLGIEASLRGDSEAAKAHFEAALSKVDRESAPFLFAELLQGLSAASGNAGLPDTETLADRAVEASRRASHEIALAKSLIARATVALRRKDHSKAVADLKDAAAIAAKNGQRELKSHAQRCLLAAYADRGDLSATLHIARDVHEDALYLATPQVTPLATMGLMEAYQLIGRSSEAVALGKSAVSAWGASGDPFFRIYGRLVLAQSLMETVPPRFEECARYVRDAIDAARAFKTLRPLASALLAEIERRVAAGEPPATDVEAELDILVERESTRMDPELILRLALARARRDLTANRPEDALRHARVAIDLATKNSLLAYESQSRAVAGLALRTMGRISESKDEHRKAREALTLAANRISDGDDRRTFLARPPFRIVQDPIEETHGETARLTALYDMIRALNSETDPEALLPAILDMALGAVHAERGMILLTDPATGGFSVRLSRNLEKETASDAEAYSRGIAAQAGEGQSILALDAGHDERFKDLKSVSLYRIRSLMCVPLRSRGRIVGTVYLDSRREGRMFSQEDLRFVEAFADHAALALENARARARLEEENRRLRAVAGERTSFASIIGRSQPMQRVFDLLQTIAKSELPVLVLGESGTGKELVAKAIHFHGPRKAKVFLSENCAALPESLLESTLFGHVRGAFTGADRDRAGLFEQADGGTLFLDEVGDMSPTMQARLLRVLQEGEVRRVGDERVVHVDVRVIAATNKDLEKEIREGRFREDLFYRLNVLSVPLPPLRERPGDIALLTASLVERIAKERGRATPRVDNEVLDLLERYSWPGNVRQLENVLQRLSLLAGDGAVTLSVLESDENLRRTFLEDRAPAVPVLSLAKNEEEQIRRALEETAGNRDRAARLLGISRATVYRKIKEYGIR